MRGAVRTGMLYPQFVNLSLFTYSSPLFDPELLQCIYHQSSAKTFEEQFKNEKKKSNDK